MSLRKSEDGMLAGVCAGLGEYLHVDPVIIRLIFVICTIAGVGAPILIYILL